LLQRLENGTVQHHTMTIPTQLCAKYYNSFGIEDSKPEMSINDERSNDNRSFVLHKMKWKTPVTDWKWKHCHLFSKLNLKIIEIIKNIASSCTDHI